jgi:hypothetical protein
MFALIDKKDNVRLLSFIGIYLVGPAQNHVQAKIRLGWRCRASRNVDTKKRSTVRLIFLKEFVLGYQSKNSIMLTTLW